MKQDIKKLVGLSPQQKDVLEKAMNIFENTLLKNNIALGCNIDNGCCYAFSIENLDKWSTKSTLLDSEDNDIAEYDDIVNVLVGMEPPMDIWDLSWDTILVKLNS